MAVILTADDARQSLTEHVALKGHEIREKYGSLIGWNQLLQILGDRSCVRYPCEIVFDGTLLRPGEFAVPIALGLRPDQGFRIHVHPWLMTRLDRVPFCVLYQLVQVNYGEFASAEDAETFGSCALGMAKDEYYNALCEVADLIGGDEPGCSGPI